MNKQILPKLLIVLALLLSGLGVYVLLPQQEVRVIDLGQEDKTVFADILDQAATLNTQFDRSLLLSHTLDFPDSMTTRYSTVSSFNATPYAWQLISEIRSANKWPYAGFNVILGDTLSGEGCENWQIYDHIEITMNSTNSEGLHLQTFAHVPEAKRNHPAEFRRLAQIALPLSRLNKSYEVDLKSIQTPLWWKRAYNISLLDTENHHQNVCSFALLLSPDFAKHSRPDTLNVYSVKLTGEQPGNSSLGLILIGFSILLLIVPILKPEPFGVIQTTQAARIELSSDSTTLNTKIQEYYENHYMSTEDSAQEFAKQIGIHPKKLQEILRKDFKITHKAWLNHLRIGEAQRLLSESEAMIGDIADAVGFRTLSHFNRVFKEKTGLSPKDYRHNNSNPT